MRKYSFEESKKNGYYIVVDPEGMRVAELYCEPATVVCAMYNNLFTQIGERAANEFMYGYILGITHQMIFADKHASCQVQREGGMTKITMCPPKAQPVETDPEE